MKFTVYNFFALFPWQLFIILGWLTVIFVSIFFCHKYLTVKFNRTQREELLSVMQRYTDGLEQQQHALVEFKRYYINKMIPFHDFLEADDFSGLKEYFYAQVSPLSKIISQSDFAVEALCKINVDEIKSIIAAKLMVAQSAGIDVSFEADEVVDRIPIDSVALVRMLGIILDNSIEAIKSLGQGTLRFGCFRNGDSIIFTVQNPCLSDIPELHQLKRPDFTTKGKGRGLGLSILSDLISANPNVMLETSISNSLFTQTLLIEEAL